MISRVLYHATNVLLLVSIVSGGLAFRHAEAMDLRSAFLAIMGVLVVIAIRVSALVDNSQVSRQTVEGPGIPGCS